MQSNNQTTPPIIFFYRLPKVREICGGVSSSTVWSWVKSGKNGFPRPVKLSENCTAWDSAEINRWAAERIAASQSTK